MPGEEVLLYVLKNRYGHLLVNFYDGREEGSVGAVAVVVKMVNLQVWCCLLNMVDNPAWVKMLRTWSINQKYFSVTLMGRPSAFA